MKLKLVLLIFFLGINLGVVLSPWANSQPQKAIISPVSEIKALENTGIYLQKPAPKQTLQKIFAQFDREQNHKTQVLGQKDEVKTNPNMTVKSIIEPNSNKNGNYTIAVFGDSMVDTMETNLPYLDSQLKIYYPNIKFNLLNYGVGSQNAKEALQRFDNSYNYQDRNYPSILATNPDIIIVGSFAYNPMESIDEYDQSLRLILQKAQSSGKPVYMLATIAPLKSKFGAGPGGVNWDQDTAWTHATKIQDHMERAIAIAQELGIAVIDCYHLTINSNGEGVTSYVSSHDGIHPSIVGHQYIAGKIASYLKL